MRHFHNSLIWSLQSYCLHVTVETWMWGGSHLICGCLMGTGTWEIWYWSNPHSSFFLFLFFFLPHPFHLITAWLCPHHCRCFCHAAMKLEAFCKLKKAPCRQKLACYSKILHGRNIFNTEAKQLQIYGGNEVITDTSTARMAKFSWRSALQIIYSNYLECYFHFKEPS